MTHVDALVVGGGIGGLRAALALADAGLAPVLLEARSTCGGLVFGAPVGGVWVDLGAEGWARRSRPVAALCDELGLPTVDPAGAAHLWSHRDGGFATPIPHGVLGIPTDLGDPAVARLLSPEGLERASADLTTGPDAGADAPDLGTLVEARLGPEALTRLVAPVAGGVHAADPATLAVDVVSPGLREALAREGSLVRAAAALRASAPAGAVMSSVAGGLFRLPRALTDRMAERGGTIATGRVVTALEPAGDGWRVTHHAAGRATDPAARPTPVGEPETVTTGRVVVALDGPAALGLLRGLDLGVDDWTLPVGADLTHVTVVLDAPALDAAPCGSGVLVTPDAEGAPRRVACKALTHVSAKWPAVVAGTGAHALRLSYPRAAGCPAPTLTGALADASVLLGVALDEAAVRGHAVVNHRGSLPPHTPGHRDRVAALTARVAGRRGLAVTGAWCAGTGLAAVIPHAEQAAKELVQR